MRKWLQPVGWSTRSDEVPRPTISHALRLVRARGAIAASAAVALIAALASIGTIHVMRPGFAPRTFQVAAAATNVLIDEPRSTLVDRTTFNQDRPTFVKRASLYSDLLASPPVIDRIAQRIGVPPNHIAAVSRLTAIVQQVMREPDSEQRASQLLTTGRPYRLDIQSDPIRPVIHIYAQAPSVGGAKALADAAVASLEQYLREQAVRNGAGPKHQLTVTQLGPARGSVINAQARPQIVVLTFLVVFALSLALLRGIAAVRRGWRETSAPGLLPFRTDDEDPVADAAALADPIASDDGDWPHTTRVMPWLIAGFLVILWLVPFNQIQLTASLPFDLKLDRLVLPFLFAVWVLTLAIGGPTVPRLRLTLIHLGVAGFIAAACLGVVLNADELNRALEFGLSIKKLSLLLSYGLFFLIVASSVRRTEVPTFMKYTLGLAVICAIGTIWEYRFRYNVFFDVSGRLLPGIFQVATYDPSQVDDIGRRITRGPAEHPLETVAMLTMALPIALAGIIHTSNRRSRWLYGLAACLLLAAAITTYRKSALLAPLGACLTIAYFRRRELLRLAPVGLAVLVAVHILSPGALGSVLVQFHPNRLDVATVSDRASDYDAIRPDVWTHLLFGRGYGTYDHVSYRILDSDILNRLIDTGVIGLLAFVVMLVSIVLAARRTIRARHPVWAPAALAVAASSVAFLILAFLFDITSFPHTPYILLSLAGLLAVVILPQAPEPSADSPQERQAGAASAHPLAYEPALEPEPLTP